MLEEMQPSAGDRPSMWSPSPIRQEVELAQMPAPPCGVDSPSPQEPPLEQRAICFVIALGRRSFRDPPHLQARRSPRRYRNPRSRSKTPRGESKLQIGE